MEENGDISPAGTPVGIPGKAGQCDYNCKNKKNLQPAPDTEIYRRTMTPVPAGTVFPLICLSISRCR
jgi:hypothetical protein